MEKQNDYFLNLLSNPTFSATDFTQVGLSVNNTSIQDKSVYLNSDYIKNLDIFKTNGNFDQSKFDNFYDYAKKGYTDLTSIQESEDLGNTWMAYRNDISMPEYLRDNKPQFKIEKVQNPLRQQSGFVTFGLKENPTQSIREIAQTQLVEDPETGEYKESPNDTWFDNFLNPKVFATYDEDGTHEDPITGEIVSHKKGERKLNKNGTYYYENLGNRSIYGKEVLSAFDTLTTEGSKWNKLDFLDSDDIEKSTGGSIMRAAAQIVPAFIPGVNTWYIGARVGLGVAQILPAVGKVFESITGTDTKNSLFNKIEAWDKALSFSQSDYTQGSQTDDGQILSDSHLWSMETGLKLVADVFTQLAEQRWMFEKTTQLFSGLSKDVISSREAQTKWIEDYIKNNSGGENVDEILLKGISKGVDPRTQMLTKQRMDWSRAQNVLSSKLKGAQELGSKISMAYMTGITTADSYGQAKEAGASDLEAALFTLGYTFGEWKLLNSDLGKWILPELKSEERHIENIVNKAMPKIKEATKEANTKTEIGKAKWYQKLFNIGANAYHNNLGQGIANEAIGATVSNMASEALEETSEELLLDLSKTLFNAATSLTGSNTKFDDAFKNVFDRYALSFLGGAVGGGIAGYLPAYQSARFDRSISKEAATKEIVDLIQQGKDQQLINVVNRMTFGNKYLDENGNPVNNESESQDSQIKKNFARLVSDIKDILTVNGADLDEDSLLKELGPKDLRYAILADLASQESNAVGWYINRYNELSSQLVSKSLELKHLNDNITDKEKREGEDDNLEKEKTLKEEIKKIKDELDKFKDGTMSDEFIQDAVFEMITKISGLYIPTLEQKIKEETGKSIDELSDSEREAWIEEFNASRPIRRDIVRLARMAHIKNMEQLAKIITDYNEEYFRSGDKAVENFNEILFGGEKINGHRLDVINDEEQAVPKAEQYLAIYPNKINPLLYNFQQAILAQMDKSKAEAFISKIATIIDTPVTLARKLGISVIPETLEELKALDEKTQKRLFTLLEEDDGPSGNSIDLAESIKFYTETKTNEETGESTVVLNKEFKDAVNSWQRYAQIKKTEEFNSQLIAFLSNEDVKNEIIRRLKSAKFILPTVRQALTDFFTSGIKAPMYDSDGEPLRDPESDEIELFGLNKKIVDEYLDSFKDVPSSPVDLYLSGVVTTLKDKGIEISPLVSDINGLVSKLARAKNLESFSYDDDTEKLINQALQVIDIAVVGLDSAATTINGDLSDAFGFNATINEIREKRGKSNKKLAMIPSDVAEGIKLDILRYKQDLLFFKSLQAYNSNSVLNEHDKTYKVQSLNLYTRLKTFVGHLETPDWDDLDKLKAALQDAELTELFENIDSLGNDQESKERLTAARLKIDVALHEFFKANASKLRGFKTKEERDKAVQLLSKLIKDLKIEYKPRQDVNTEINLEEKSIPDKDLLWYLASMAAADPRAVLNEYSEVISGQYAPVIGQEEAIRTTLSFLIDPKVFNLFADAYNENLNEERKKHTGDEKVQRSFAHLYINAYRSIFIEGIPGSGKSSATLKTLTDILDKFHPNLLKNIVIVSNSKENSRTLAETLGFDGDKVKHFGIEEFRGKILNNYKTIDSDETGSLKINRDTDIDWDSNRAGYRYRNFTINPEGLEASIIIIDEATSLSQMDAIALDEFMEAKDIYGIYAGDFDQLGVSGKFKNQNGQVTITQDITNYISTHKLGQAIRGNNTYKSRNTTTLKINKWKFAESFTQGGKIYPIDFSYYMDSSGVYGDVVAKADSIVSSDGRVGVLDQKTKDIIDTMIKSLKEGEKINYIYDNIDSEMYKYLHENYADKINEISTKAAQSQEGQYYIVDVGFDEGFPADNVDKMVNQFKTLYTAISRAKQATLIYDRFDNNEILSKRINSTRIDKLITTNISAEARQKYATGRKTAIKKALGETNEKLTVDWKKDSFEEKTTNPVTDEDDGDDKDDTNEEETYDDKTDVRNTPKEIDIINNSDDSLNMMIHSFNTHECGGFIDDNGQLNLGERGTRVSYDESGNPKTDPTSGNIIYTGERIDNANGIVKILKLPVDKDGKLSVEDTQRVLTILHKIRTAGLYEKNNGDIVKSIKDALGLGGSSNVSVRFIYKNCQKAGTLTSRGPLSKWFRSIVDRLLYLFTGETNEERKNKQETPVERFIGLEIFVDGQQLEVPVGTLTSPATLIKTKGFEKLNEIFESLGGKPQDLPKLHKELLTRKQNGEKIPHLDSMIKLLEITQWNFEHTTGNQNFTIRFNKDFVLNSKNAKLTGVQTPPRERGKDYKDPDYWYPGRRLSLSEYRSQMPNRKISNIYENPDEDIKDSEGNVALEHGIPFILVSDYYTGLNDRDLYKQYIKQITTPGSDPLITRVYVYIPTESIDYFLYNQQEALKKDPNARASDLDSSIGNKLSTYRLLSFMLQKDSKFIKVYENWIKNNSRFNEDQKKQSLKRLKRIQDLLQYIVDYENSLIPSSEEGSVSKQILKFLEQAPENLRDHQELVKIIAGTSEQGWIGNMKQSLRTTLLQEFRKLLFSKMFYETYNPDDDIKYSSPSLSGQEFEIIKTEDGYEYKDYQIDRINALKEDAERNGWSGVMFHTSLEKENELISSQGAKSYRVIALKTQDATYISSREVELNGKLDTTAVITDVEPMLDEILSKLVVTKDGSVCSSKVKNLSDDGRKKIYNENTGAYLRGENPDITIDKSQELLNQTLNIIEYNSDILKISKRIKKYIEDNGTDFTPEQLINLVLSNENAIIKNGSKYKIIPLERDSTKLVILPNETYYLHDKRIYRASDKLNITDVNILQKLLTDNIGIQEGADLIIQDYINKLNISTDSSDQKINGQDLLDDVFGEGISFEDLIKYDNETNYEILERIKAIYTDESTNKVYDPARYLLNFILKQKNRTAWVKFARINGNGETKSDEEIMSELQSYVKNKNRLEELLKLLNDSLNINMNC